MPVSAADWAARPAGHVSTTPLPNLGSWRAGSRAPPYPRLQENATSIPNYGRVRAGGLVIAASAAGAAAGTSVSRPRSADVLGVVILDTGKRSPAADDLLLSVASMYGRVTRREVVAVANNTSLEAAVRGCMEDGATKVMVVPYCTSLGAETEANPAIVLAEVQGRLPGIRCMMGDTIAIDQLLTEFIESQVRIVEGKRAAVPERWSETAQQPRSQEASSGDSLHTSSGTPWADEWQGGGSSAGTAAGERQQPVWSDAAAAVQEQQWSGSAAQQAQQAQQAQAEPVVASSASPGSSGGGGAAPSAWSDDMANVLVFDYRGASKTAADGSASTPAPKPAAWGQSGIVGSSFDVGDASGPSSGEDKWNSHLSQLSSFSATPSSSHSKREGSSSGSGGADSGGASAGAAQPQSMHDKVLERRLSRMEEQLQHITALLESQPPAQQAQQAQQAPAWQSAMFEPQAAELVEAEAEANLYSPQQLAFLARKRAAKRGRAVRP